MLAVWNLDRLGRGLQDLLTFVDNLVRQGIGFVSLTQEWANTTSPIGTFLFQVFGGLAVAAAPSSRPRACNERRS